MKKLTYSTMLLAGLVSCNRQPSEQEAPSAFFGAADPAVVSGVFKPDELRAFTALNPIDAHAHVRRNEPVFNAMIDRLNLHLLNIVLVDDQDPEQNDLKLESNQAWTFIHAIGGRATFCTTFDPFKIHEPGFAEQAIRGLNQDFDQGAIAVKIWKNLGMEIKNANGNYILPDDPALAPIYKDIAAHNKTLVSHVADPDSAWAPLSPASPDYSYFKENKFWFMYDKPHPVSKAQILLALDHVLEQNPNLRVVGAHLGSMETDLDSVAQHLDRYPNFAVDLSGRIPYLALQPRPKVIAFIRKYQDRLIYGSDLEFSPRYKMQPRMRFWEESYANDWRFLATSGTVEFEGAKGQGLALPDSVLRKIFHDNAVRWFPGIYTGAH